MSLGGLRKRSHYVSFVSSYELAVKSGSFACRYDFALPLLVLHAFEFHTAQNLKNWLTICPRRQITVLDTHDGMGVDDIAGLAEVSCRPFSHDSHNLHDNIRMAIRNRS